MAPPSKPAEEGFVWVVTHLEEATDLPVGKSRVELEVRTAAGSKRVAVGEAVGGLMSRYQSVCHPRLPEEERVYPVAAHELTKISFFYAGADIFAVRHRGGTTYEVVHAVDGHEECASAPCELPEEIVATFSADFERAPDQAILLVNGDAQTSFTCRE